MPAKKYANGVYRTFYVDGTVYHRAKQLAWKLGKPIGELINDYLRQLAEKLEGKSPELDDYESLKRQYAKLVEDTKRYVKMLKDTGSFETMHNLAVEYGLDFNSMHNADEVAAKLLETADIPEEALHTYISLLEVAKKKREVGRKLTEIRCRKYLSGEGAVDGEIRAEADATAHTLQRVEAVPAVRGEEPQESA